MLGNNMFAYCQNAPVTYCDPGGFALDYSDILNRGLSGYANLGGNATGVSTASPSGGPDGFALPFFGFFDNLFGADDCYSNSPVDKVVEAKKGWEIGDDITNLTKAGRKPSWSTVRNRYWKNEAFYNSANYSQGDLIRMRKGLAPQMKIDGRMYSKELHHKIPRHIGGSDAYSNLLPVWPWEHAMIDPFRFY